MVCSTLDLHALVAQRLEQQTHNLLVVGSNPTEGIPSDSHVPLYEV